jgi:hypothetical protein
LSVLLAGLIVGPIWNLFAAPAPQQFAQADQRRETMTAAMDYLHRVVPPGGRIFTDYQSSILLSYYLERDPHPPYRVISAPTWTFEPQGFPDLLARMKSTLDSDRTGPEWVFVAGWGSPLVPGLARFFPTFSGQDARQFGQSIVVFRASLQEFQASQQASGNVLLTLAQSLAAQPPSGQRSIFWPSYSLSDSAQRWFRSPVMSYHDLYQQLQSRKARFDDYLPALAFWLFDTPERHVQLLDYMNDGESYISGPYRFTLLAMDPDSVAAVYRVEVNSGQP